MLNRSFGLIVHTAETDKMLADVGRMFADLDDIGEHTTPLPASEIGGGYAFPDSSGLICRRIYACGVVFSTRIDLQTSEQMAKLRSDEMWDEWWW